MIDKKQGYHFYHQKVRGFVRLLFLCLLCTLWSCEKEGILLEPQLQHVAFKIEGLIDGESFNMSSNTVMLTGTRTAGSDKLYSGELFGNCENDTNCKQSLSIEIRDSIPVQIGSSGFPIVLETGAKSLGAAAVYSSVPQFCIQNVGVDSLYINSLYIVSPGAEQCIEPLAIYPNFEVIEITAISGTPDTSTASIHQQQVMVSRLDDEVLYYYFKINCIQTYDSCVILEITIEGNTNFDIQDFAFSQQGNIIDLNVPIKLVLNDPLFTPNLFFSAYQLATGQVINFGLIQVGIFPAMPSFDCSTPYLFREEKGIQVSENGIVSITYTDVNGKAFTSHNLESVSQTFIINSTSPYLIDGSGNQTVVSVISYAGQLMANDGEIKSFENMEMVFGFGY